MNRIRYSPRRHLANALVRKPGTLVAEEDESGVVHIVHADDGSTYATMSRDVYDQLMATVAAN